MAVRLDPLRNPLIREHAERRAREAVLDILVAQLTAKFDVPSDVARARLADMDRRAIVETGVRALKASGFDALFAVKRPSA